MRGRNAGFARIVLAGCTVACMMSLVAMPLNQAMAASAGSDGAASVETGSDVASGEDAKKSEGPLGWLFSFLFGKSSGSEASSSSVDATKSSASDKSEEHSWTQVPSKTSPSASRSSAAADDPFSGPVESEAAAVNRVHDCLMRAGKELPQRIEFDRMTDDGRYVIHGYEVVSDGGGLSHDATLFWYSVGKDGSIYDEVMMCDIDPLTMEKAGSTSQSSVSKSDYYTLSLPWQLAEAQVTFEKGSLGGTTTVGDITTITLDGQIVFEVVCFSDDWGPQGTMGFVKLGSPSNNSHCDVYVTVPAKDTPDGGYGTEEARDKARKYAAYVSLK